jgi:hypothetical protein
MSGYAELLDTLPTSYQYATTGTELEDAQAALSKYTGTRLRNAQVAAEQEQTNLHRARQRLLHTQQALRQDRHLLTLIKWSVALVAVLGLMLAMRLAGQVTASGFIVASALLIVVYLAYFTWWAIRRLSQPDAFLHGLSGAAMSETRKGGGGGGTCDGA